MHKKLVVFGEECRGCGKLAFKVDGTLLRMNCQHCETVEELSDYFRRVWKLEVCYSFETLAGRVSKLDVYVVGESN